MELVERQNYAIPIRPRPSEATLSAPAVTTVAAPLVADSASAARLEWVDVARGIAILLVVLGHAMTNDAIQHLLQPFRMPLFYITAGYLFNARRHREALGQYLVQRCRRLILPYFLTAFVFFTISLIVNDLILDRRIGAPFKQFLAIFLGNGAGRHGEEYVLLFNLPLWYLTCMTSATLLFVGQLHFFRKDRNRLPLVIGSLTVALFGYLIGQNLFLPWSFDVAMVAQFFLIIGFLLRENEACFADWRLFLFLAAAYLGLCLTNNFLDMNRRQFHDFGQIFVAGLAGTYMLYFFSRRLTLHAASHTAAARLAAFFRFFGRHTLVIMTCHFAANYFVAMFEYSRFRDPFSYAAHPLILFPAMVLTSLLAIAVINKVPVLRAIYYK